MESVSEFMKRFGPEIEVIWGTATEKDLGAKVKITLLATGFGMSSIPGIEEHLRELSDEELREEEERQYKEEEEKRRINVMIEQHYGKDGVKTMDVRSFFTPKPVILSTEELDDDRIVEALENTPVFKRGEDFNPNEYKPDNNKKATDLFN